MKSINWDNISAGVIAVVLLIISIWATGDLEYAIASVSTAAFKLSLLLVWAWIAGRALDRANKDNFDEDKKRIDDGNMAVAISRTGGFAVLVLAGAAVLGQI